MFGNAACYLNVSVMFRKLLVYYVVKYTRKKTHLEQHHKRTDGTLLRNKQYYDAPLCYADVAGSSVM